MFVLTIEAMKRSRTIFYIALIILHLAWFVGSFIVEANKSNFDFLFGIRANIPYLKYITGAGLLLILLDYLMVRLDIRRNSKRLDKVEEEKNAIKAQMYDLISKEAAPPTPPVKEETSKTETEEENES